MNLEQVHLQLKLPQSIVMLLILFYFYCYLCFTVKKNGDSGMLPLECPYLNKTALFTVVGQQVLPIGNDLVELALLNTIFSTFSLIR